MTTELLAALSAAVGAAAVALAPVLFPGGEVALGEDVGRALAVVRPGSTAEVAAVVRACAAHGTPLVPQGGNTGLVGGSVPDGSGRQVLLSLTRLNRVRAIDPVSYTHLTLPTICSV